jgi:hypothetical protein
VYKLVLAANVAGINAIKAGSSGKDVDAQARKVLEEAGLGNDLATALATESGWKYTRDRGFPLPLRITSSPEMWSQSNQACIFPENSGSASRIWWW